jgi:hypothetical protein
MTKYLLFISLFLTQLCILAQGGLQKAVNQLDTATTSMSFQRLADNSVAIIKQQPSSWLAYYWCSYGYASAAYLAPRSKKDALLDKAQEIIDQTKSLKVNRVELLLLQSWIYSIRITVVPASRLKEFGGLADQNREEAFTIDPNNPRYYFLKASSLYYTPPAMGGGKSKAQPLLEEAIEKYESYPVKEKLYPSWGRLEAEELLKKCK